MKIDIQRYLIKPGSKVDVSKMDPKDTQGLDKEKSKELFRKNREEIVKLQEKLYAQDSQ